MKKTFLKLITIVIFVTCIKIIAAEIPAVTEMDPTDSIGDYVNLGEWNTDGDFDGWTYNSYISDCAVYGGSITGRVSGNDEHIDLNLASAGLYINLSSGMVVEIRCRYDAGTANNWSQWFLNGTGQRVVYVRGSEQQPTDGNFHVFRTTILTNFGSVNSFRFDQLSGQEGDTFSVDYIRIGRFTSKGVYTNTVIPVFADNNNFVLTKMQENTASPSFGWLYTPASAWNFSWDDHHSSSGFTAIVNTEIDSGGYSASLDLSTFIDSSPRRTFLFGGWIKSTDTSYRRDFYAYVRLSGDHAYYKDLLEFSDRGVWTYFEQRINIPENINNVKLTLNAFEGVKKVYFSSLYFIPESSSKPVWRKTTEIRTPTEIWQITNCEYRLTGTLSAGDNNQPVWCDFDLARLILMAGSRQPIDPSSIKVVAVNGSGSTQINVTFDNPLSNTAEHYKRNGTIKWRSVIGYSRYEIYFNLAKSNGANHLITKNPLGIGELLNCSDNSPAWVGWPGTGVEVKDVDNDGDWDIYGNTTDAGVWLLRNIGNNSSPLFLPRQKPLETDAATALPVYYTDIDWNTNGSSDVIVCEKHARGSYIDGAWLEMKINLQSGGLVNMVDMYGVDVVLSDATWYASANGDFDGDGLADVVVGTTESDLTLLLNRGMNSGNPRVEKIIIPFNIYSAYPYDSGDMALKPFVIDWNKDGRDDIMFTAWEGNCYLLINSNNTGKAEFQSATKFLQTKAPVNTADSPTPEVVDWDNDGDLDLLISDVNGHITYFENQPTNSTARFVYKGWLKNSLNEPIRVTPAAQGGTVQGPAEKWWGYLSCQAVDVDNDGDIDLIINDSLGRLRWIENIGTRSNPVLSSSIRQFQYKSGLSYYNLITPWRNRPGVADWTGDGSIEIVVLNDDAELVRYSINSNDPDKLQSGQQILKDENGNIFKLYSTSYPARSQGRSQFDVGDWDNDGDLDILAGRPRYEVGGDDGGNILFLENVGSNADPRFKKQVLLARGLPFSEWVGSDGHDQWHSGGPCMVDWDSDGKLDLIFGTESGRISFYNHDYFVGSFFPVLQSLTFENKTNVIFDFQNDINIWTESLETSQYPLEWVTNGPAVPESGIISSILLLLIGLIRHNF